MTNSFASLVCVLLADDSHRVWGRFDHQRGGLDPTHWLIIGGALALLLVSMLVSHLRAKHGQQEFWHDSPSRLLHELSHAHRLDAAHRKLIRRLASERGAEHPADVFVEPEFFDTTNLSTAFKNTASELRQLRHQLFE